MIEITTKAAVTAFFGLAVIASGLYRFLAQAGGEKGLWFGLVTGTGALAAAWLIYSDRRLTGMGLAWTVVALVGGWFFYECLIDKGLGAAEPRMLAVLLLSAACAGVLCLPSRTSRSARRSAADAGL